MVLRNHSFKPRGVIEILPEGKPAGVDAYAVDAVKAGQRDQAVLADQFAVHRCELFGVDRNHRHPHKIAVGGVHTAGELQGQLF